MRVSVFGLGYVGSVTAACLATDGHQVVGVDSNPTKVELLEGGKSLIVEDDLPQMLADAVQSGRLVPTTDHRKAMEASDLAIVCVGTPSESDGSVDLSALEQVIGQIGSALSDEHRSFVVVVRSTIRPGDTRTVVIPALEEASGRTVGEGGLDVCFLPEFLREGSSVSDYYHPPKVVVAGTSPHAVETVLELIPDTDAPVVSVDFEVAEMVKYVDNAWHGLKVGFANEIGRLAKSLGVDSREVMDLFKLDRKLNISPSYLSPGFAFGGSCLPKDLRAIEHAGRINNVDIPILGAVLASNQRHVQSALEMVASIPGNRVGILGLSFKAGTDDLRESPMVELVERLVGKGYDLRVYDPAVHLAALIGANRAYIMEQIPHVAALMVDSLEEAVTHGETLVIGNGTAEFEKVAELRTDAQTVVDLVGLLPAGRDGVVGICW